MGLSRIMTPLGSACSGKREPWSVPGWRWGINPMPSRRSQPNLPGPTDGLKLLRRGSLPSAPSPLLLSASSPASPTAGRGVEPPVLLPLPHELEKSRLTLLGRRVLDEAAQKLHETPNLSIALDGFSDAVGSDGQSRPVADTQAGRALNWCVKSKVLIRQAGGCIVRGSFAAAVLSSVRWT